MGGRNSQHRQPLAPEVVALVSNIHSPSMAISSYCKREFKKIHEKSKNKNPYPPPLLSNVRGYSNPTLNLNKVSRILVYMKNSNMQPHALKRVEHKGIWVTNLFLEIR